MNLFANMFDKIYTENVALTGMTEELFSIYVNKLLKYKNHYS